MRSRVSLIAVMIELGRQAHQVMTEGIREAEQGEAGDKLPTRSM